jgi:putative transposase
MPTPNIIKKYVKEGIYHVYNRANNYNELFSDNRDYNTFLLYIRDKLTEDQNPLRHVKKYHGELRIFAFCLMPTHFHLLLQQTEENSMTEFMKSLQLSYSFYKKITCNNRGRLYESRYKARLITSVDDLLSVSRYIHLNPKEIIQNPEIYEYSSLKAYISNHWRYKRRFDFLDTRHILQYYKDSPTLYLNFIRGLSS